MTAKIVKFPAPVGYDPEIARLREITAEAANNELLGAGPPQPEAALLDICAEALHLLTRAQKALDTLHRRSSIPLDRKSQAFKSEGERLYETRQHDIARAKPILRRIAKVPAATAVGIYAKALCMRASRTGAPALAMTLAEDLIACPGLRESLWPVSEREA